MKPVIKFLLLHTPPKKTFSYMSYTRTQWHFQVDIWLRNLVSVILGILIIQNTHCYLKLPFEKMMHISHVYFAEPYPSNWETFLRSCGQQSQPVGMFLIPVFKAGKHLSALPLESCYVQNRLINLEGGEVRHEEKPK